jgi:hypothetical protein
MSSYVQFNLIIFGVTLVQGSLEKFWSTSQYLSFHSIKLVSFNRSLISVSWGLLATTFHTELYLTDVEAVRQHVYAVILCSLRSGWYESKFLKLLRQYFDGILLLRPPINIETQNETFNFEGWWVYVQEWKLVLVFVGWLFFHASISFPFCVNLESVIFTVFQSRRSCCIQL